MMLKEQQLSQFEVKTLGTKSFMVLGETGLALWRQVDHLTREIIIYQNR